MEILTPNSDCNCACSRCARCEGCREWGELSCGVIRFETANSWKEALDELKRPTASEIEGIVEGSFGSLQAVALLSVLSPDRQTESRRVRSRLRCDFVVTVIAQSQVGIVASAFRSSLVCESGTRPQTPSDKPTGIFSEALSNIHLTGQAPLVWTGDRRERGARRSGEPLIPVFTLTGANTGTHSHTGDELKLLLLCFWMGDRHSGEEIPASFLCENYPASSPSVESSNRIRRVIAPAPISRPFFEPCTLPNPSGRFHRFSGSRHYRGPYTKRILSENDRNFER